MKKYMIFMVGALLGLSGCVDLDLVPEGSMAPDNFFKSEGDANSAVISVYSGLGSHYFTISTQK